MPEPIKELLINFRELSKIDLLLFQTLAEKNKLNDELNKKSSQVQAVTQQLAQVTEEMNVKQRLSQTQDAYLKEEQQKLVARRKSIQSLNDYKLQEKANKEIDQANKQLLLQEESLLQTLDLIDNLKTKKTTLDESLEKFNDELSLLQSQIEEGFAKLDLKIQELQALQLEITQHVSPKDLNFYKRISNRYPGNAVVSLNGNSCTGCYFSLSPQVLVQVARGIELQTCPSCGRLLCAEQKSEEKTV